MRHLVAFGALLVLAGLALLLSFTGAGAWAALLLASLKALIVLAVFMRLSEGQPGAAFGFGVGVTLLLLLVLGVAGDVLTRG